MTGYEARRMAMVECQLRPNQVTDKGLLDAMRTLPRERFVPPAFERLAYMDEAIEVFPAREGAPARFLLAPMVQARLIQLAEVEAKDKVLDVGCGTGYSAAILARLAATVIGLEPEPALAKAAAANLVGLGLRNTEMVEGPFAAGWPAAGPYDVIVLEGSVSEVPDALLSQLKEGGRLVAVITAAPNMQQGKANLFVRVDGEARGVAHFDAGASPLPGVAPEPAFVF
ncbi:protein-L-isoaspartate O-methyltransferase family protein [Methyloceanibacter superfactus]|jgi:protein-L-isoaspartate(D-aspartate) O-methyltransferase|nr:protein-L-isoaspartate O-methyltransferase [Methyloceanibacter superfactus]